MNCLLQQWTWMTQAVHHLVKAIKTQTSTWTPSTSQVCTNKFVWWLFLCLYIEKCIQTNYSSFQVYILIIICVPWNEIRIRIFLYFIPCFFSTEVDEIPSHLDKSVFTPLAFGDADLPATPTQGLTLDSKRWPLRINGIFKVWVWNEWILCSVRSSRYKWFKQYVFRRVLWKHRDWRGQSQNKCVLYEYMYVGFMECILCFCLIYLNLFLFLFFWRWGSFTSGKCTAYKHVLQWPALTR